jgi:ATP-dependent RNA helicase DDX10/DBP4
LDPSEEEGMLKRLEHKKVPIQKTKPRQKKQQSIKNQLQNMCFQDPELKYLGQKAFSSYAKSLYLQKDKEIFKLQDYDLEGYAASMGLPGAPKIKFLKGDDAKKLKNAPRPIYSDGGSDSEGGQKPKKEEVRTKYDRMFERRNQDVLSGHYTKMIADGKEEVVGGDADEDDDFLSVKRVVPVDDTSDEDENSIAATGPKPKIITRLGKEPIIIDSKRKEKLLKSKKRLLKLKDKGTKLVFDEEGNPHQMYELENIEDFEKRGPAEVQRLKFLEEEAARVREADLDDKAFAKQKKRDKKEKKKAREAAERDGIVDSEGPQLVPYDDDDDGEDPLEFLRSLPLAEDEEESEEERPAKRPKKWFEDAEEGDEKKIARRKGRVIEADDEPETLEDLEALAAGLLH